MQCPSCGDPLPQTGTECPACGADVGWHVRKPDGSVYGPLDVELIDRCLREGRIVPGDLVQLGSEGQFRPAHELLADRLPARPPPTTAATIPPAGGMSPQTRQWLVRGCAIAGGVLLVILVLAVLGIRALFQPPTRSCLSNLKQLDLGLLVYTQDYDDLCPPKDDWEQKLNPYLRNNQLWICPTCPKEPGYAKNDKLAGVKMQNVRQPAQTLTFWDAGASVQGFPPPPGTTSPRHNAGDNFAFVDGHAKYAQPGHLQAYTDP